MSARIMVALSGGVDSSVAAYLLKEQGYDVTGVTMSMGIFSSDGGACKRCGPQEIEDARAVCRELSIKHHVLDFTQPLRTHVIDPFIAEYGAGRTPNPCVECNRYVKFGLLLEKVLSMGFDSLATGHYARIVKTGDGFCLARAKDARKDQTYFLSAMDAQALKHVLFPLADYTKDEVKDLARRAGLPVSNKPESQDICFIPSGDTEAFLKENLVSPPGEIVNEKGRVLGEHRGMAFYTIGQRARLGVNSGKPLYVLEKDIFSNRIIVAERSRLCSPGLIAQRVNLFVNVLPGQLSAKIRYAHQPAACRVHVEGRNMIIVFDEPQEAVTPGQTVALYAQDMLVGSGIIKEVFTEQERL